LDLTCKSYKAALAKNGSIMQRNCSVENRTWDGGSSGDEFSSPPHPYTHHVRLLVGCLSATSPLSDSVAVSLRLLTA